MRRHALSSCSALLLCACVPAEPGAAKPSPEAVVAPVADAPTTQPPRAVPPDPPAPRPSDPSWQDLEIDAGCTIRMAKAPTALDLPLHWSPCPTGAKGCVETTTAVPDSKPFTSYRLEGFAQGGSVIASARLSLPGPLTRVLVGPVDGLPFLAVEAVEGESCSLGQVGLGEWGGVLEVVYDARAGYGSRAYLLGPLGDDPSWRTVAARMLRADHPRFIGESVARVGERPFVLAAGGPLLRPSDDASRWGEVAGSRGGWTCCLGTSGEVITLLRESIPEVVLGSRNGGELVRLLEPRRGEGVSEVRFAGARAVWVQGSGRNANNVYRRVELWSGRLEPTPAIVDRRMVAELRSDLVMPPLVSGELALAWEHEAASGSRRAVLVSLADGERHELPAMELRRVLWLGAQELAVELGPSGNFAGPLTIRRLPLPAAH